MSIKNTQILQINSDNSNEKCRLCGRHDLKLVDIFSEEGLENDLSNKIEMHIPIKLVESKEQRMKCCSECVATILSWHNFVLKVLEVNQTTSEISTHDTVEEDCPKRAEHINDVSICLVKEKQSEHESSTFDEEEDNELNLNILPKENSNENEIEVINSECNEDNESFHPESKNRLSSEIKSSPNTRRRKCEVENKYFCEFCDRGFTRKYDMERHKKLKHNIEATNSEARRKNKEIISKCKINENGKVLYECDFCQKRMNNSYNLMRHRTAHTGVKPYICHICGNSFRLYSSFSKHIKQFHEGVKKYKCDICDKTFGVKSARDQHMNTHTGRRPYTCDICQKSFKQSASLYVHKLYHNKNFKFECTLCDKKFRRARELEVHDRTHSGHRPYSCDVCSKEFKYRQTLNTHMKVHSRNDVEWMCAICESTFTQERYLKRHKKVHK